MRHVSLTITANKQVIPSIYEMRLEGDVKGIERPGQFVNVAINGLFLRRPFSISDYDAEGLTLLYKTVGVGSRKMAAMGGGEKLDILNGLGNGFSSETEYSRMFLAGGGIGIAPLYKLAKELKVKDKIVSVALCFNTANEVFYAERFRDLGVEVYVATVDGSVGCKGYVTNLIDERGIEFDYFYACGPMPMIKSICQSVDKPGEVSLEARMGCGFGICMGCSIPIKSGYARICKEGPVFRKEDLVW